MTPLPLLLSLPHAGLRVPEETRDLCQLTEAEIIADGDEHAADIYGPLRSHVTTFVTTDIARAVVDMNRAEDDIRKDGVVKTHTCWDVLIYKRPLKRSEIADLIARYHRPYHQTLRQEMDRATWQLAVDCHTMAGASPPIDPHPGTPRPQICLSNGDGTCPQAWFHKLKAALEDVFDGPVTLNEPFKGGYITRTHGARMPWVQLEMNRALFVSNDEKSARLLSALTAFCRWLP